MGQVLVRIGRRGFKQQAPDFLNIIGKHAQVGDIFWAAGLQNESSKLDPKCCKCVSSNFESVGQTIATSWPPASLASHNKVGNTFLQQDPQGFQNKSPKLDPKCCKHASSNFESFGQDIVRMSCRDEKQHAHDQNSISQARPKWKTHSGQQRSQNQNFQGPKMLQEYKLKV